jgi:hypothetical protein
LLRRRHLPCVDCHVVTYYNLFDVLFFYCFQVLLLDSIRRLQFNDCEPTLEFQFSLKVFQGLLYIFTNFNEILVHFQSVSTFIELNNN